MKLSQIKDLVKNPTHDGAEELVQAISAQRAHLQRTETMPDSPKYPPFWDKYDSMARVLKFLLEQGISCDYSTWTNKIVIKTSGAGFYYAANGGVVSQDEYEIFGFTCDHCSEVFQTTERAPTEDSSFCRGCATEHLYFCRCENIFMEGHCDEDGEDCPTRRRLHNYTTNVETVLPSFLSAPGERLPEKPLWLGVELEVAPKNVSRPLAIRSVQQIVRDFAILKPDASVRHGFEITSVPATLEWHRQKWPEVLAAIRQTCRSWTDPACGIHVHFSREALTPLQMGKILVFINAPANQRFVWRIAGRSANDFALINHGRKVKDGNLRFLSDHHDAIAVSARNGGRTLELRIFRGNLSEYGFMKNLEFVDALAQWSTKASINHLGARDFVDWMRSPQHRKSYPHLDGWLTQHKYYKVSTRPRTHLFNDED